MNTCGYCNVLECSELEPCLDHAEWEDVLEECRGVTNELEIVRILLAVAKARNVPLDGQVAAAVQLSQQVASLFNPTVKASSMVELVRQAVSCAGLAPAVVVRGLRASVAAGGMDAGKYLIWASLMHVDQDAPEVNSSHGAVNAMQDILSVLLEEEALTSCSGWVLFGASTCLRALAALAGKKLPRKTFARVALLCAILACPDEAWSLPSLPFLADSLLRVASCGEDVSEAVAAHAQDAILLLKQPFAKWKDVRGTVSTLSWLVERAKRPYVDGKLLSVALPPVLRVLDDYESANKATALRLLHHLFVEGNPSEIRWHSELLFQALYGTLVFREEAVLQVLLPALTTLLTLICPEPAKSAKVHKTITTLLDDVDKDQKLAVRKLYLLSLSSLVELVGAGALRYTTLLVAVSLEVIVRGDDECCRSAMGLLLCTLFTCWLRMASHAPSIVKVLARCFVLSSRDVESERLCSDGVSIAQAASAGASARRKQPQWLRSQWWQAPLPGRLEDMPARCIAYAAIVLHCCPSQSEAITGLGDEDEKIAQFMSLSTRCCEALQQPTL